jgi:hypothetical protein
MVVPPPPGIIAGCILVGIPAIGELSPRHPGGGKTPGSKRHRQNTSRSAT